MLHLLRNDNSVALTLNMGTMAVTDKSCWKCGFKKVQTIMSGQETDQGVSGHDLKTAKVSAVSLGMVFDQFKYFTVNNKVVTTMC